MDVDDLKRDKYGLVVCIRDDGNGHSRIILDDVKNLSETGQGDWRHETFMTWKEFDSKHMEDLDFSEQELAVLGRSILARLLAIKEVRSKG